MQCLEVSSAHLTLTLLSKLNLTPRSSLALPAVFHPERALLVKKDDETEEEYIQRSFKTLSEEQARKDYQLAAEARSKRIKFSEDFIYKKLLPRYDESEEDYVIRACELEEKEQARKNYRLQVEQELEDAKETHEESEAESDQLSVYSKYSADSADSED